jgi:hypothetical protein
MFKFKRKALFTIVFVIIIGALEWKFLGAYKLKTEIIQNIITFLSIVFGFYITSLAVFVSSRYVSELYKKVDETNRTKTLLHALVDNYKFGLQFTLLTVLYLIILQLIANQSESEIVFSNPILYPFGGLLLLNFYFSYNLLVDLTKVIIQEAKNNEKTSLLD